MCAKIPVFFLTIKKLKHNYIALFFNHKKEKYIYTALFVLAYIGVHNIQKWVVATPLSMTSASLQGMEVTRFQRYWELCILVT